MTPKGRRWSITENARNIHKITIHLPRVKDEQWVLLQTDVHFDNPHCQRDKLTEHLDEAIARDAPVFDNGDFACAMGGKWDPRSNKGELRPEYQRADYLDALVEHGAAYLQKYKDILTVRGRGNHEAAIAKRHETDLTGRLVERLRTMGSTTVKAGGYSGYVIFDVVVNQTRHKPIKMFYHHGYGGGGPVTRGTIQTARQAAFLADADLVFTGHTHDTWKLPIARVRLNNECTSVEHIRQEHLRGAGYKEEYADGYDGWHIERGAPPKPVGAWWLRIHYAECRKAESVVAWDAIEAK